MQRLFEWFRRLRFLAGRSRYDAELGEEISFHLEQRVAELVQAGHVEVEARRLARRQFGNPAGIRQDGRDVWAVRALDVLTQDVRVALRGMRRSPGFAVAALLTLALGIGGATTVFSLVHAALLAPLPYPDPDRIVTLNLVSREDGGATPFPWSFPKFEAARGQVPFLESVAGFNTGSVNLRGDGVPERLVIEEVSASYFPMLGARAAAGRLFTSAEDSTPNQHPVVVISHRLWRSRFGGDSGIIGRPIVLGTTPFVVVGVMSPAFRSVSGLVDLWAPLAMIPTLEYPEVMTEVGNHFLAVIARLAPGVTVAAANQGMAEVGRRVDEQYHYASQRAAWSASATPLDDLRADPIVGTATLVLMAAVSSLLLIACANVAGLLLVRAVGRGRELAIRAAVGAGPRVLARQLIVESLTLSAMGGGLGLLAARFGVRALVALSPESGSGPAGLSYLFDASTVSLSAPVLFFALGVTALTGVLVGIVPARRAVAHALVGDLKGAPAGATRSRPAAVQRGLIGLEAALAVVLLIGAGLMIRSFVRLSSVDLGFVPDQVLTFRVNPADQDLAARDPVGFKNRVLPALAALPGVTKVGVNLCAPLTGACNGSVVVKRDGEPLSGVETGLHVVDGGYFEALGIPLIAGRAFGPEDRPGSGRVVIVNRAAAAQLWPGADPIGKRIAVASGYFAGGDSLATVVGVVGDVRYGSAERPAGLDVYTPALQKSFGRTMFFVRTSGPPAALTDRIRQVVRDADPSLPVFATRPLTEIAAAATARTRFLTVILSLFSALALVLAAVGVYGVVAFAVRARAKEISIRLAVGADPRRVVRLLVGQSLVPVAMGMVVGVGAAVGVTRLARGLLFGIEPGDAVSFGAGVVILAAAGALACWVPARRAARTDPLLALKADS